MRCRFFRLAAVIFITLCLLAPATFAQSPPAFEVTVQAGASEAVAGQPFTYTIILTNVGSTPAQNIVVQAATPAGTVLRAAPYTNTNWLLGGASPGEAGDVVWFTRQNIAPGEVNRFQLVVDLPPDTAGRLAFTPVAVVALEGGSQTVLATGPVVQTPIRLPTPTPSPAPPAPAPTPTPPPTPLPATAFTPEPPAITPPAGVPTSAAQAPAPSAGPPAPADSTNKRTVTALVVILVIIGAGGVYWRVSRR